MQTAGVILAFLALSSLRLSASGATGADAAQSPRGAWHIDLAGSVFAEAWDLNESTESLSGAIVGVDRHIWRAIAVRGEALLVRVAQRGDDAWLRGVTGGTRIRWTRARVRPVIDVAVGVSNSTMRVPLRGTRFNYLAVIGSGIETQLRSVVLTVTGRWLHASNNGREGRGRNPDIQALGVVIGVGWSH